MSRSVIIGDPRKESGLQFMDGAGLSSPEKRDRDKEHNRIMASGDAEAIEAYRQRCLEEAIAGMQANADEWLARNPEQLTEIADIAPGRIAA